jgi:hypothetical protein
MFPCFGLMLFTVAAVWALRVAILQDWHPFARLLLTSATIAVIMMCGTALVYGRALLSSRSLRSDLP